MALAICGGGSFKVFPFRSAQNLWGGSGPKLGFWVREITSEEAVLATLEETPNPGDL